VNKEERVKCLYTGKMSARKMKRKSLQATATTETKRNFYLAVQGRKLHLKIPLEEVENTVRSPNI
jgi:hypothetical protein